MEFPDLTSTQLPSTLPTIILQTVSIFYHYTTCYRRVDEVPSDITCFRRVDEVEVASADTDTMIKEHLWVWYEGHLRVTVSTPE